MKRSSLLLIAILMNVYSFSQDAVLISENSSYSTINIRANTTSIPNIRFTRYTGTPNHQHNAFIGQFLNPVNAEYSFGIGTGFSTTGDQDFTNNVLTATLTGLVGIGTVTPNSKLDVQTNVGNSAFRIQGGQPYGTYYFDITPYLQNNPWSVGYNLSLKTSSGMHTNFMSFIDGKVGIKNINPRAFFDVGGAGYANSGQLNSVFGRLPEGDGNGEGTYLGIRTFDTQPTNVKSFALEHSFFGQVNNSINFHRGGGMTGGFISFNTDSNIEKMRITANGYVGIGTTNPDAKLAVKGTVHAEEVKVDLQVPGPDYVFEPTYQLPTLTEIENYIKANKHLPDVPSAKEMEANGIYLSEMNMLLLKKVEELTLYMIEQQNQINKQQQQLSNQQKQIQELLTRKN